MVTRMRRHGAVSRRSNGGRDLLLIGGPHLLLHCRRDGRKRRGLIITVMSGRGV